MSSRRRDKQTHVGQHRRSWACEKAAEQRRLRRLVYRHKSGEYSKGSRPVTVFEFAALV